jgi:hypothetical protein
MVLAFKVLATSLCDLELPFHPNIHGKPSCQVKNSTFRQLLIQPRKSILFWLQIGLGLQIFKAYFLAENFGLLPYILCSISKPHSRNPFSLATQTFHS